MPADKSSSEKVISKTSEKRKRVNPYEKNAEKAKKRAQDWYDCLSKHEKSFLTVNDYPGV